MKRFLSAGFILGWLWAVGGIGCTLINQLDKVQCASNDECAARGGEFRQSVCGVEGICVALSLNAGGSAGGGGNSGAGQAGQGGTADSGGEAGSAGQAGGAGQAGAGQGGAAGAAGGAGAAGSGAECATNKDCVALIGGQVICKAGTCVSVTSKECTKTIGDVTEEPDQIFGVMTPQYGTKSPFGTSYQAAIATAFKEYRNQSQGAIVGFKAPLLVMCDEQLAPEEAAKHLIDTVGVKAIIGPSWGTAISKVLPRILASNTIALLPSADDPSLAALSDKKGQIWTCKPNRAKVEVYWKNAVAEVEKMIKAKPSAPDQLEVALIVAGDASSQTLATRVIDKTDFNGKSQSTNASENKFFRLDYGNYQDSNLTYGTIASSIIDHPSKMIPNLIILISSGDGAQDLAKAIETGWPSDKPRPNYLFVGGREGADTLLKSEPAEQKLSERTYNLDVVRDQSTQDLYKSFRSAFQAENQGNTPRAEAEYFYDCFWLNQYAFFAATEKGTLPPSSVTGESYTKAITLLNPDGEAGVVGAAGVTTMLGILKAGGNPDLGGAGSALDLSTTTGTPVAKGGLNCAKDKALIASGLEFDPETGAVSGTNLCP